MRSVTLVVVCAGLLGASSVPTAPQDPGKGKFVLEAGKHEMVELINRSALYLGRNYLYSESDVLNAPGGVATLQHRLELDAAGCEAVVGQIAYSLGFAMMPIDEERGIYEWVFRQGPKRGELAAHATPMLPDEVLANPNRKIIVLTSLPLLHFDATAAMNHLRPFFLVGGPGSAGGIQFGAAGSSLLIQGFADQVAAAVQLLRRADAALSEHSPAESEWREDVERRLQALEERVGK